MFTVRTCVYQDVDVNNCSVCNSDNLEIVHIPSSARSDECCYVRCIECKLMGGIVDGCLLDAEYIAICKWNNMGKSDCSKY